MSLGVKGLREVVAQGGSTVIFTVYNLEMGNYTPRSYHCTWSRCPATNIFKQS